MACLNPFAAIGLLALMLWPLCRRGASAAKFPDFSIAAHKQLGRCPARRGPKCVGVQIGDGEA